MKRGFFATFVVLYGICFFRDTPVFAQVAGTKVEPKEPAAESSKKEVPSDPIALEKLKGIQKEGYQQQTKVKALSKATFDKYQEKVNEYMKFEKEAKEALKNAAQEKKATVRELLWVKEEVLLAEIKNDLKDSQQRLEPIVTNILGVMKGYSDVGGVLQKSKQAEEDSKASAARIIQLQKDFTLLLAEYKTADRIDPQFRETYDKYQKMRKALREEILANQKLKRQKMFFELVGKAIKGSSSVIAKYQQYADDLGNTFEFLLGKLDGRLEEIQILRTLNQLNKFVEDLGEIGDQAIKLGSLTTNIVNRPLDAELVPEIVDPTGSFPPIPFLLTDDELTNYKP